MSAEELYLYIALGTVLVLAGVETWLRRKKNAR